VLLSQLSELLFVVISSKSVKLPRNLILKLVIVNSERVVSVVFFLEEINAFFFLVSIELCLGVVEKGILKLFHFIFKGAQLEALALIEFGVVFVPVLLFERVQGVSDLLVVNFGVIQDLAAEGGGANEAIKGHVAETWRIFAKHPLELRKTRVRLLCF
jgi:hypothetical protein